MQKKHNPYILLFFILCLLCSGMCLDFIDMIQVDSFFSCKEISQSATSLDTLEEESLNEESCTVEMLGICGSNQLVQNARTTSIKIDTRLSFLLVCAVLLIYWTSKLRIAEHRTEDLSPYDKIAILNYIHNQDGKK